jgi:hypothetical protein
LSSPERSDRRDTPTNLGERRTTLSDVTLANEASAAAEPALKKSRKHAKAAKKERAAKRDA